MHKAISTKVQGKTHMWYVLKHILSNFLNFLLFICFWIFTHTKLKHKSKIKNETMHTNKCKMHKMYEDMTFNAWKVLQRLKELDQGPKGQKLNHRNPSSSKRNDCLEWMSQEKWEEGWKNENWKCTLSRS